MHVWLGVNPVKPRAAQNGMFVPLAPEPVRLELTLARIKSIVGQDRVGSPELLDTHRPGAFRLISGTGYETPKSKFDQSSRRVDELGGGVACPRNKVLALRVFRPPRPARVALASGQPSFIAADGVRGKVQEFAGPWRTSGDWWTSDPWQRDEWDIALSDGALYRLYCSPRGWFLEGRYD